MKRSHCRGIGATAIAYIAYAVIGMVSALAQTISMEEAIWAANCTDQGISVVQIFKNKCDGNPECTVYIDNYQWRNFNEGRDPCFKTPKAISAAWLCDGERRAKNWGTIDHRVLTISCKPQTAPK